MWQCLGERCEMIDDPCVGAVCDHGECRVTGQGHGCICDQGWSGDHCDVTMETSKPRSLCHPSPCYPGVSCSTEDWFFSCGPCPPGLAGDGITCVGEPCNDITCHHDVTAPPQQTGILSNEISSTDEQDCSGDISACFTDHCLSSPCHPGVECTSLGHSHQCGPCPVGMAGDGHSCVIDHCAEHNPCFPGVTCYNHNDKAKCGNCPAGFEGNGIKCTAAIDPCASSPCYHGVQCINVRMGQSTGYVCGLCPDGMEGDGETCHDNNDPCSSSPCHQGVACIADGDTFSCGQCPDGWSGDGLTCSPLQCDGCYPGVRCKMVQGQPSCGVCPPGMRGDGRQCQDIDDCAPNPCHPGVFCSDKAAPARGYDCGPCPDDMIGDGINCRPANSSIKESQEKCTRKCQ